MMPLSQPSQPPHRWPWLDGLRVGAALLVVFFHFCFRGYAADGLSPVAYPTLAPVAQYGYLGV